MSGGQDIIVRYNDLEDVFDADLQLTLDDIRGHFGISGGSLKMGGKIKVVKASMIVPPGSYTLEVPAKAGSGAQTAALPPAPTPIKEPQVTSTQSTQPITPFIPSTPPETPTETPTPVDPPRTKVKRELEAEAGRETDIKKRKSDTTQDDTAKPHALPIPDMLLADEEKPTSKPLPTFLRSILKKDNGKKTPQSPKNKLATNGKPKPKFDDAVCNKENEMNFDLKAKINIQHSTTNHTSSVIASITSSSQPTTPERKRQKNEIITKILAREADRKMLRERFMGVEQLKEEMAEEDKAALSSSEVLHLCEVSWFNRFREEKG